MGFLPDIFAGDLVTFFFDCVLRLRLIHFMLKEKKRTRFPREMLPLVLGATLDDGLRGSTTVW